MRPTSVGIREFRQRLAEFLLNSDQPVAVTKHGATIGYFIPARGAHTQLNRGALKEAAMKLDKLLQREGITNAELDDIARHFRSWRKRKK